MKVYSLSCLKKKKKKKKNFLIIILALRGIIGLKFWFIPSVNAKKKIK